LFQLFPMMPMTHITQIPTIILHLYMDIMDMVMIDHIIMAIMDLNITTTTGEKDMAIMAVMDDRSKEGRPSVFFWDQVFYKKLIYTIIFTDNNIFFKYLTLINNSVKMESACYVK
jgi:hypothetical protein